MKTYIYLLTNINNIDTCVYVGKTKNIKNRKEVHIRKHGEQITFTIIDEVNSLNKEDWKPLECKWIQHYKDLGYEVLNKNKGGGGPEFQSQYMKDKMKLIHKGNKYNVGIKQSSKTIKKRFKNIDWVKTGQKISEAKKGKKLSEETKIKLRKPKCVGFMNEEHKIKLKNSQLGISKFKNKKPILQYDLEGNFIKEWPSQTEAGKSLNIKQGDISAVIYNKQKTAGKYIWKLKIK